MSTHHKNIQPFFTALCTPGMSAAECFCKAVKVGIKQQQKQSLPSPSHFFSFFLEGSVELLLLLHA